MEQLNQEPVTDMTAAEYFNGEGSPLTLDKILQPQERDFLLEHIELYAQGKVNQFKISLAQMDKEVAVGFSEWSAKEDYIFYAQRGSWAKRKLLHPTWFTTTELYNGPYQDYLATLPTPPTT